MDHKSFHEKTVAHIDNNPDVITLKNPFHSQNTWKILTVVFGIALIVCLYFLYQGTSFNSVSGESAGKKLVDFLNGQAGGGITYVSSKDLGNVYEVTVLYDGQNIPVYVTKDGDYFVQSLIPLDSDAAKGIGENTGVDAQQVSADDDPVLGNADAPVTIVEFSDYQCPFCGRFWSETLPQLKKEYIDTGKAKLVFRDFPLSDIHPDAQKASEAAECARKVGGETAYWKMHDKLFEYQQALSVTDLKKYAKELGLSASFDSCLDSGEMAAEIAHDQQDGARYGVDGTPAFFVNGKPLMGAQPFSAFKQAIDAELA
ncbi:MAG: hypothetical protein RL557_774 [archaeon]|jgi:protein-disulfide isomerase